MRVHEQLERVPLCRRRVRIIRRGLAVGSMAMLLLMVEVMTTLRVVMMMLVVVLIMVLIMVLSVTVTAIRLRPWRGRQAMMRRMLRRSVVAGRMRRTG